MNQKSEAVSFYDMTTGLVLSTTALNDLTTSSDDLTTATEYDDLLRPIRSYPVNFTAPEAVTEFGIVMTEAELTALIEWVAGGGRAIVADRVIRLSGEGLRIETGPPRRGAVVPVAVSPLCRGVLNVEVTDYATIVADEDNVATVHFASDNGAVLIDRPYGADRFTFLTDRTSFRTTASPYPTILLSRSIWRVRRRRLALLRSMNSITDSGA